MERIRKFSILCILVILIFMVSEALASGTNTINKIELINDKLTVNVENVSLSFIFSEIHEKTGIEFLMDKEESDRVISVQFQLLPIEEALDRILNNLNHAIVFDSKGKIHMIKIVSKSTISSTIHKNYISLSSNTMVITRGGEDMIITNDGEDMVITHGGDKMKITYDGEPMKITNDGEEMKITHDGEEMKITHP